MTFRVGIRKRVRIRGQKSREKTNTEEEKEPAFNFVKNDVVKNKEVGVTLSISTDFHALVFYFLSTHQDGFLSLTDKLKLLLELY